MANQIAGAFAVRGISRSQLGRLMRGQTRATDESISIVTASCRELTGYPFQPSELFQLELGMSSLNSEPQSRGRQQSFPLSSPGSLLPETWRALVTEDSGNPPEDIQQLYIEHGVIMRAVAMRRFRIPPDDAEDIVHDALLDLLQRPTQPHNPRGWLVGNVKHRCMHYWRDRSREVPLPPEHDQTIDTAPDATLEVWERRLTISAMLARIGPKCRETLRGFYLDDETNAALAQRLRKAPTYIYVLLSACRRRLSELFRATRSRRR